MKNFICRFSVSLAVCLAHLTSGAQAQTADPYSVYLNRIQNELKEVGSAIDVYSQNPFQTGTALKNYYLNERTLLLERDAFFQMKANRLKTTEEVADFHHRTRVLRMHGNNMMLQLLMALEKGTDEGFSGEEEKHRQELEGLVKECENNADCLAAALEDPSTELKNILIDNFKMAKQVFKAVPFMHALEVNSVYQMIQLVYLEVFYAQAQVAKVEFDLFQKKQKSLHSAIQRNGSLTPVEKELHREMTQNTLDQWKLRILERKFDHQLPFDQAARDLYYKNYEILYELDQLKKKNPELLNQNHFKKRRCFSFKRMSARPTCKLRNEWVDHISELARGRVQFLGTQEQEMPESFWEELK